MSETATQRELFSDYSALLMSLLPDAEGFLFHDRKARLYWRNDYSENFRPSREYQIALLQTIKTGEQIGEYDKVPLDEKTAFIFQLTSETGWPLGAVTVIGDSSYAEKTRGWVYNQIAPALNSLQRELGLRFKLVKTHKRLTEKASDHDFLRLLGEHSRSDAACEAALHSILECFATHLNTNATSLIIPNKRVELHVGNVAITRKESDLLIDSMNEAVFENTQPEARQFRNSSEGTYNCTIYADKRYPVGVLSVKGPADDDFVERLNDIAEALGSAIEYVLDRDFDPLTGLPKWPVFEAQLSKACEENSGEHVVMFFDIDRMQLANDTFGRNFGDEMIRKFANVLRPELTEHAITRISGNYCAALLQGVSLEDAEQIGKNVCAAFKNAPMQVGDQEFRNSVSVGVAPLIVTDEGVKDAMGPAQVACEAAKDRGRGRVEIYQSADESIVKRLDEIQIIGNIRTALAEDRLELYAQPIASLTESTAATKFEVLVRMLDENGDAIEPGQFISAAERFQIMPDLDRWVVGKSIAMLDEHQSDANQRPRVAINLSGQSLGHSEFVSFLRKRLNESRVSPEQICFEITETVAIANLKQAQAFVREFRALGCQFALDDFGTGLSSFTYLKLFPVNALKIDGSFIKDIEQNEISRSMVIAISEIAKVMELETVAEFVGNANSTEILREMGIGWIQGHYVGKPRPLVDYMTKSNGATVRDYSESSGTPTMEVKALPDDFLPELALQHMRLQNN